MEQVQTRKSLQEKTQRIKKERPIHIQIKWYWKKSNHLNRLITLSPLTDMARNFHIKNGAKELQVNKMTQNFEYDIALEDWETALVKAKGFLKVK